MARKAIGALIVWSILAAGLAWALSDADTGTMWNQASSKQKIEVVNVLSRVLGGDPGKYLPCLDKFFADPKNVGTSIREAAQQCKAQP